MQRHAGAILNHDGGRGYAAACKGTVQLLHILQKWYAASPSFSQPFRPLRIMYFNFYYVDMYKRKLYSNAKQLEWPQCYSAGKIQLIIKKEIKLAIIRFYWIQTKIVADHRKGGEMWSSLYRVDAKMLGFTISRNASLALRTQTLARFSQAKFFKQVCFLQLIIVQIGKRELYEPWRSHVRVS